MQNKTLFKAKELTQAERLADIRGTRMHKNSDGTYYVPLAEVKATEQIKTEVKRKKRF